MTDWIGNNIGAALRLIELTHVEAERWQPALGNVPHIPDLSFGAATTRADAASDILRQIDRIDAAALPYEVWLTLAVARARCETWARDARWYWTAFDPTGSAFYSLFAPTAYSGGFTIATSLRSLAGCSLLRLGDRDRYLAHVSDFARMIADMHARTRGQAERGMYMPRVQAEQAKSLLPRLRAQAMSALALGENCPTDKMFVAELDRRLNYVDDAFEAFEALLDPSYMGHATDTVGMGQYREGPEIYSALVKLHTTQDLTADEIHAAGLERMGAVRAAMAAARTEAHYDGDDAGFRSHLDEDPAWRATTPTAIGAFFQRSIDRLDQVYDDYFHERPAAAFGVEPLSDALSREMTFGYYDIPKQDQPRGIYYYNKLNLAASGLFNVASLNYHELVPGHHLQIAAQLANLNIHPLRRNSLFNAYNEGWAEYAATFVGEIGLYVDPAERFGRSVMDAFLTCRLVVDTGLNARGWSLERARDYMRENAFMPEREIRSETIRYSCDIPGQSLAYRLGDVAIIEMRETMREALAERFDIRDFHAAVLNAGSMPLPLLRTHVAHVTQRLLNPDS